MRDLRDEADVTGDGGDAELLCKVGDFFRALDAFLPILRGGKSDGLMHAFKIGVVFAFASSRQHW